jgi:uncharacterized LabA/DUF88 family protein
MDRVCIFIDGSNFYYGLKHNIGKTNVNFHAFSLKLYNGRKLIRTYYYNAPVDRELDEDKYKSQQKFFDSLKKTPFLELKLGRLVTRDGVKVEKGVDVYLAVDMLKYAQANTYDTAILVSGDGDFASAVNAVMDLGKHVENAQFRSGQSQHLRDVCDVGIQLDADFLKDCFTY